MDKSLFEKYSKQITKRDEFKEEIQLIIKNETGLDISRNDFLLIKKTIQFQTSSVMKVMLKKHKVDEVLIKHGYIIK